MAAHSTTASGPQLFPESTSAAVCSPPSTAEGLPRRDSPHEHPTTVPLPPLTFSTPLAHWSQLVVVLCELHLVAGKALARAMNGNDPTPDQVAELRALFKRAYNHLADGANLPRSK